MSTDTKELRANTHKYSQEFSENISSNVRRMLQDFSIMSSSDIENYLIILFHYMILFYNIQHFPELCIKRLKNLNII